MRSELLDNKFLGKHLGILWIKLTANLRFQGINVSNNVLYLYYTCESSLERKWEIGVKSGRLVLKKWEIGVKKWEIGVEKVGDWCLKSCRLVLKSGRFVFKKREIGV